MTAAGWVDEGGGRHVLSGDGGMVANVDEYDDDSVTWQVMPYLGGAYVSSRSRTAPSVDAAKLAAEDALIAVRDEISWAVGR